MRKPLSSFRQFHFNVCILLFHETGPKSTLTPPSHVLSTLGKSLLQVPQYRHLHEK